VHWRRLALVEQFSSILYPLDVEALLAELPTLGYIVPAEKERLTPRGEQLAFTREIATKGELRLRISQDAKLLGIEGNSADEVLAAFKALRDLCEKRLDPSEAFASAYIEITGTAWVDTGKEPTKVFGKVWSGNPVLERLGKSLKKEFTQRGIKLASSQNVQASSFSEIEISPVIPARARYHVQVVWREPTVDSISRVMKDLDSTILNTIRVLESS
jgi:hypothetical protein